MLVPRLLTAGRAGGAAGPGTLVVLTHPANGEVRFLQFGSGGLTDPLKVGGEPYHIVRDMGRGRVYVTDRAGDSIAVIDVLSLKLVQRVTVGREPHFAAMSPDGKRLYVPATADGVLTVVDLDALTVTGQVPVGNRPVGVAVSGDGSRVFVANDADETVVVVDPGGARRPSRPIPVPMGVQGALTLSTDGGTVLSAANARPALAAISFPSRQVREIALGPAAEGHPPRTIFATPDGRFWLVGLEGSETVIALPAGGGEPRAIRVDDQPTGFAVAPGGRALVSSHDGEQLIEVDLDAGKVTRRIRVGSGHTDLTVFSKSSLETLRGQ